MTRKEENRLDELEDEFGNENRIGLDAGLEAMQAAASIDEPAETPGAYLAPEHNPAPVLQPADEGGWRLVPAASVEPPEFGEGASP